MEENEKQSYHLEDTEDFGLHQSEYEAIEREEGDVPPAFQEPTYYQQEEEESNHEGIIIASILGFLVLVGLGVYLFGFGGKEQVAAWFGSEPTEQPQLATPKPEVTEPELEPAVVYKESEPEPVEEVVTETPASMDAYSTIEAIPVPTGRSYIVIGSFVDEDLARDFGEKLLEDGTGIRILAPTDRAPLLHRVAIADFDTFNDALAQVEEFRLNYGDAWALRY